MPVATAWASASCLATAGTAGSPGRLFNELWGEVSYRRTHNSDRPHSSLGYLTPAEMRARYDANVDTQASQSGSQKQRTVPALMVRRMGSTWRLFYECPRNDT